MHISGLKQSRFLTRADVGNGILVTIAKIYQENVAKEGAPEEYKWCVAFEETEKPWVLNSTNGQIIAKICHSEETDDWIGHKIVLFDEPNISFAGKLVGGIRTRAPRPTAAPSQRPTAAAKADPRPPVKPQQPPPQQAELPSEPEQGPDSEVPF